jgi:hypothetical protein
MKKQYQILVFLFFINGSGGFCQEGPKKATELFPKDFVRNRESTISDVEFENSTTKSSGSDFSSEDLFRNRLSADSTNEQKKSATLGGIKVTETSEFDGDDLNVVAVRSVGVILNSDDSEHVKTHSQELQEFNSKMNIPVSKVYLIGATDKFMEPFSRLIKLGFSAKKEEQYESALVLSNISYLPNVPNEYEGVEYSPTWLLDTEYGLILVEGEQKKLKSYFDDKGNFKLGKIKLVRE